MSRGGQTVARRNYDDARSRTPLDCARNRNALMRSETLRFHACSHFSRLPSRKRVPRLSPAGRKDLATRERDCIVELTELFVAFASQSVHGEGSVVKIAIGLFVEF